MSEWTGINPLGVTHSVLVLVLFPQEKQISSKTSKENYLFIYLPTTNKYKTYPRVVLYQQLI